MNTPCLTILQLTDLPILPSPDDDLLGVKTETYFHRVLDHAFRENKKYDALAGY